MSKPKIPEKLRKPMQWDHADESPEHFNHRENRVSFLNSLIDRADKLDDGAIGLRKVVDILSDRIEELRDLHPKADKPKEEKPECAFCGSNEGYWWSREHDAEGPIGLICEDCGWSVSEAESFREKTDKPEDKSSTCDECGMPLVKGSYHTLCVTCYWPDEPGEKVATIQAIRDYVDKKEHTCKECGEYDGKHGTGIKYCWEFANSMGCNCFTLKEADKPSEKGER